MTPARELADRIEEHLGSYDAITWPDVDTMRQLLQEAIIELRRVNLPEHSDASHRS